MIIESAIHSDQEVGASLMDRRSSIRYPIQKQLTYKFRSGKRTDTGSGTSVNVCSSGVLFTTSSPLHIGCAVELAMEWPVLLGGECPLKFIVTGPVVRATNGWAAVRIDRYEFRTRRVGAPLEVVPPRAQLSIR